MDNVHPFCPEEQATIGEQINALAAQRMKAIQARFDELATSLVVQRARLDGQVMPLRAAERYEKNLLFRQRNVT